MAIIAHLSDMHFGAADPAALAALKRAVDAAAPDLVVVTGDLTQAGRRREFDEAARYFASFAPPLMALPGNHDAPVYSLPLRFIDPWRRFRRAFGAPTDTALTLEGATIVGLNSARRAGPSLDWSKGRLSTAQLRFAEQNLAPCPDRAARVVALHHPVTPGPGRAGAAVVGEVRRALDAFAGAGVDLILTGHVHVADAIVLQHATRAMIVARAGTAASTRLRGEAPSFNIIATDPDRIDIDTLALSPDGYAPRAKRRFIAGGRGWRAAPE